ncbi:PRC-barrel domain-containing protein [Antarcticirhabdus aurantiaca]|uniref:PRC-barrel domain-containing protein n=1 Tax=Antarcticirhabdus aurantiaca TaxID=2606717 RepID=A0ACD4NS43_9HYPH|nr:PRC-barrel domain-containing protein [Antarcticirhabdus aurantiaca]WAJ29548.1 PRC-barrel domain-containing protein [Jeongeuplla avenae]
MIRTFAAALLGSTLAMSAGAFAQEANTQPMQPSNTGDAAATQGSFLTIQQADQMLGSNLMDANVVGAANEDIGEVEDLLLDQQGRVIGVVVEVGGFLGIGDKEVAIPSDAMRFVLAQDAQATASNTGGTTVDPASTASVTPGTTTEPAAGTAGTATMGVQPGTMGMSPGATSPDGMNTTTASANTTSPRVTNWGWTGGRIDHIQIDYTREQLEAAPPFESVDN